MALTMQAPKAGESLRIRPEYSVYLDILELVGWNPDRGCWVVRVESNSPEPGVRTATLDVHPIMGATSHREKYWQVLDDVIPKAQKA